MSSRWVPVSTILPGFHHDDAIGALHRRQAVGDDERRAVLHRRLQRGLHHALAFRVERARGLVEQQQRRVLQDRAGDADALALAARQAHAALAEEGPVALGQRADEVVRRRRPWPRPRPRRRSLRAGRSGCSPWRRPRRSRCPAARCRCAARRSSSAQRGDRHAVEQDACRRRRRRSAAAAENTVLLPAPLGPTSATVSPGPHVEAEVRPASAGAAATGSGSSTSAQPHRRAADRRGQRRRLRPARRSASAAPSSSISRSVAPAARSRSP